MAITSQPYSDLIYLFLDGEATETERGVLFSALKENPQLQEEFASAVHVRSALATDALKLQPPAYLQAQIAEKAGLLASKLAVGAGASSALTTVPTAATPFIIKAGLLLLGGAAAGILTTVGVQRQQAFNADRAAREAMQNIRTTSAAPLTQAARPSELSAAAAAIAPQTQASNVNNAADRSTANNAPTLEHSALRNTNTSPVTNSHRNTADRSTSNNHTSHVHGVSNTNGTSINDRAVAQTENSFSNAVATTDNDKNSSVQDHANTTPTETTTLSNPAMQLISEAPVVAPKHSDIIGGADGKSRNPLIAQTVAMKDESSFGERLSLEASLPTALAMYPTRYVADPGASAFSRFELGLNYDVNEHLSIGAEAGSETFPLYLNTGGVQTAHHAIGYGGIDVRYTFDEVALGLQPYAKIVGGIATPGPIGKMTLGLSEKLGESTSVSAGVQGLVVGLKENTTMVGGSSLGYVATVSFHF